MYTEKLNNKIGVIGTSAQKDTVHSVYISDGSLSLCHQMK